MTLSIWFKFKIPNAKPTLENEMEFVLQSHQLSGLFLFYNKHLLWWELLKQAVEETMPAAFAMSKASAKRPADGLSLHKEAFQQVLPMVRLRCCFIRLADRAPPNPLTKKRWHSVSYRQVEKNIMNTVDAQSHACWHFQSIGLYNWSMCCSCKLLNCFNK